MKNVINKKGYWINFQKMNLKEIDIQVTGEI